MTRPIVIAHDEQSGRIDVDRWAHLAERTLIHEGVADGELNLLFIGEPEMAELNHEHMGEVGPTDVLSFPIDADTDAATETGSGVGERLLGDVAICPAVAAAQAPEHRAADGHDGTADDEIALLVVHGVLHVLGHDHAEPEQTAVMRSREGELLAAYHRS